MKFSHTQWKVIAAVAFAVMVTIFAGRVMEAKTGQESTAQSARVTPQYARLRSTHWGRSVLRAGKLSA